MDQEPDSIVPDASCKKCNELEAPHAVKMKLLIINTKSQTDFNIVVSSCVLWSNEDKKFMIQCTKYNSWLHYYCPDSPSYQV